MIRPILAGIETEYGLLVEGHGAESQVDDAIAFVRSYPGKCHLGWDYRYESPRSDLRGFAVRHLAVDPVDAKFDVGVKRNSGEEVRSDRILPNGARFYNDHGHPEYATPECRTLQGLARHDLAGEIVLRRTAAAFESKTGLRAKVYKNNTDFHGASYGTHESYLVPRTIKAEELIASITPMLVARTILCGAGKAGSESSWECDYQLSQRADFFSEAANLETLYRRPVFNTRDEPHADPSRWIRMHVISGDANRMASATARKVGLVKLAIYLALEGSAPAWNLKDPVSAIQGISKSSLRTYPVALGGGSWTHAEQILESYFAAAEATLELDADMCWTIASSRRLLENIENGLFDREVDWAAKQTILSDYMAEQQAPWSHFASELRSIDLEYHNVDPDENLFNALQLMDRVEANPDDSQLWPLLEIHDESTRALARGLAVSKFGDSLAAACWRSLVFRTENGPVEVELDPEAEYPSELADVPDVETFIEILRGMR